MERKQQLHFSTQFVRPTTCKPGTIKVWHFWCIRPVVASTYSKVVKVVRPAAGQWFHFPTQSFVCQTNNHNSGTIKVWHFRKIRPTLVASTYSKVIKVVRPVLQLPVGAAFICPVAENKQVMVKVQPQWNYFSSDRHGTSFTPISTSACQTDSDSEVSVSMEINNNGYFINLHKSITSKLP